MALLEDPEALIICNGYKDEEYVETALYASKLGRKVVMVVEKPTELHADRRGGAQDRHPPRASACACACRRAAPASGKRRAVTGRSSA